MRFFLRVFLPILVIFWATGAWAADKASRSASKADVIGTWEMVSVRPVHDKSDPTFYPYQRYVFNPDASMKFMTSDKPFTKEWLDKFNRQPVEVDFSVDARGVLTMTWQKRPYSESAIAAYVLKDVPPDVLAKLPPKARAELPKKGNLTLSFLNKSGKIAYQKVLAKIA